MILVVALFGLSVIESGGVFQTSAKPKQPDFSGSWTLQEPETVPPNIATTLIVKQTITDRTIYGKPMTPWYSAIEIERRVGTETRSERHLIGVGGGTVGGIREDGTPVDHKTEFSTHWDGVRLVLKTATYSAADSLSSGHQETWSFGDKGRLVVVVTDQASGLEPKTWTLVYRRF